MEVRVVAFPQEGVLRDPGAEDYVRQALEMGADVVGGIPWIEHTDRDAQEHVDRMLALARVFNRDVAMLTDDAGDPGLRNAFGQHNLLEVAFLAAHILSRATPRDLEVLLDMITVQAARVLRMTDYGLEVGRTAYLVVLEGSTVLDVITPHRPPRYVISHGRLVAQTTGTTTFHAVPTL